MSKLYVAYGSNLNFKQMLARCPTARFVGVGTIPNYELLFRGGSNCAVATVEPKEGASVPVGVWRITPQDEVALDRFEGYPSFYEKENVEVRLSNGAIINEMAYIMTDGHQFGEPSLYYYQAILQGYQDCGLDEHILHDYVAQAIELAKEHQQEIEPEQDDDQQTWSWW